VQLPLDLADPKRARQVAREHRMIYKLLGGPLHIASGPPTTVLTTLIDESFGDKNFDRVRLTPCLFQEYVEKAFEVRMTIIGTRIFPVRIESQHVDGSEIVDWRRYAASPPYGQFVDPPQPVIDASMRLMKELNINYGAFDFVVDKVGQWLFLEVNPVGQFMWIAEQLGLPMAPAMADLLGGGLDGLMADPEVIRYELAV
jgi:hypothetical protein